MRPTLLLMISATIALAAPVSAQDGWRQEAEHAPWHKRYYFSAATFDDKLWVLGGLGGISGYVSDDETCWHADGTSTWDNVTPPPNWRQRLGLQAVAFDGRLWVVGGNGTSNYNDVWVSNDGIDWTLATASAPWAARWRLRRLGSVNRKAGQPRSRRLCA